MPRLSDVQLVFAFPDGPGQQEEAPGQGVAILGGDGGVSAVQRNGQAGGLGDLSLGQGITGDLADHGADAGNILRGKHNDSIPPDAHRRMMAPL